MRIAFAIMKLFPGGGLQRDCVEIARHIHQRGHDLTVFASSRAPADFADDLEVVVLPVRPRSNHAMQEEFASTVSVTAAMQRFDLVVGFDKLTHLDVLYCADRSIYSRMSRERFLFLIPRYRSYLAMERANFGPSAKTQVLMLSHRQINEYWNVWHTPPERLTLLPPTISQARRRPELRDGNMRADTRSRFGFKSRDLVWIALCVQAYTKGLDRIVRALLEFPEAKLLVVGLSPTSTRATRAISTTAAKLGVASRIAWAGHREDVPELMAAADLLVHPARNDTTGTVILEAIVNGLPVVTTSVCGYAQHVNDAQAGIVIDEPFGFKGFCAALTAAHDAGRRTRWSVSARQYGEQSYLFDGRMRAAELILAAAERARRRAGVADDSKTAAGEVVYLRETTRSRASPSHR